jgi:hypothetical protein
VRAFKIDVRSRTPTTHVAIMPGTSAAGRHDDANGINTSARVNST